MGNGGSANKNSRDCHGPKAPGLNTVCYQRGYDHAANSIDPNPISDGIDAAPCMTRENAQRCYNKGFNHRRNN
jgi:hypothetical protein